MRAEIPLTFQCSSSSLCTRVVLYIEMVLLFYAQLLMYEGVWGYLLFLKSLFINYIIFYVKIHMQFISLHCAILHNVSISLKSHILHTLYGIFVFNVLKSLLFFFLHQCHVKCYENLHVRQV